ncbi:MAG: hypothetical protein ACOCTK_03705, partial [Candidatus Saliniplasma sp.]
MSILFSLDECDTISGKISETTKVRVMVIPIVAMLALTMVVAGWQQEEEEQVEIEVDEGYDEIVIPEEEQPEEGGPETYPQNKSTVTTHVNNESSLEFEVEPKSVMRSDRVMTIRLKLSAEGYFEEE